MVYPSEFLVTAQRRHTFQGRGRSPILEAPTGIRGVLLDYGGTMVEEFPEDTDTLLIRLFTERGLTQRGSTLEGQGFWRRYWGEHYASLSRGKRWTLEIKTECNRALIEHYGFDGDVERVAHEIAEPNAWRSRLALFPDVKPTLEALRFRRFKLGVVSQNLSSSHELAEDLSDRGLGGYFELVLTSESAGYDKPDPRLYLEAVSRLGLVPSEVCHVGDSLLKDAEAAKLAGLRGILLNRAGGTENLPGIEVISSLSELASVL